jgi:hypothetical protein
MSAYADRGDWRNAARGYKDQRDVLQVALDVARDRIAELESHGRQGETLRDAAEKLDAQAEAHGEVIHDYTDLLRVWANDVTRWKNGD